ncbi:MAG: glycosyltransferase family 4 protein [Bacteroidota bacterium]|nr:glycosyltransferase family 4 protein [Bacteroidota bacterium]
MSHPKKILIDLGKLKNRYSGLGEVSYHFGKTLAENISILKKENIKVYYLLPDKYKGAFGNEINYVSLNFFRRYFPFLFIRYNLWYAIHQDSGFMPANKTKFLLTINDLNFIYESNKNKIKKRLKKVQKKIDRADYITTISNFGKADVEKNFTVTVPIEAVYCGVTDPSKISPLKPKQLNTVEKFFFHISTIQPKKNVMALVDMMKLMAGKKLIIAGSWDSAYAKNILVRIKKENIDNIIPLSKISDNEKAWLFQNCEAFFFPSLQEGFGIPVIEAMYCGKPVFSSTHTSLPEVGSDKAFYWNNFEPEYMKNAVIEKMESLNKRPDFTQALKQYANEFTWQKNAERYVSLFKDLLSNK